MPHPVALPHLGVSVEEATVIGWHHAIGEHVQAGEPLCDISTDKVETEITAPVDGVLARIAVGEGETVPVGTLLAEIVVSGEETAVRETSPPAPVAASPARFGFDPAIAAAAVLENTRENGHGPISSPVARRLAAEHAIDLGAVAGSGRRGRICKADVLAAVAAAITPAAAAITTAPAVAPPAQAVAPPAQAVAAGRGDLPRGYDDVPHEIVATSRIRQATAEHMIRSRHTAAHMTTEVEVDMSAALAARAELNAARVEAGRAKLTVLALITRVACVALPAFPDLNATFEHERLIRWGELNIGIAVDTPRGLLVPVIRGCEQLTTPAIAEAIAAIAQKARSGDLGPDDVRAGTFTISNPGSVGAHSAMAIINQPQVAILGLPVIVRRPAVVLDPLGQETIGIRPLLQLTLTFDHRAVDGAYATRCLVRMRELLESWPAPAYA